MKIIDADALKEYIDLQKNRRFTGCTIGQALKTMIDEQPTIDAVPVIRCKDCKFYEVAELNYDGTPDKRCKPSICANGWYEYAFERDPNWFCADAEPKVKE